jgi:chromosome segregation ATPase
MTLSIGNHSDGVSSQVTVLTGGLPDVPKNSPTKLRHDTQRAEGRRADLKRRVLVLKRLIADCDGIARELDQEVKNAEDRVKVYDPADITYSAYAAATAARRDNLKRSGEELRAHLGNIEQQLGELADTRTP